MGVKKYYTNSEGHRESLVKTERFQDGVLYSLCQFYPDTGRTQLQVSFDKQGGSNYAYYFTNNAMQDSLKVPDDQLPSVKDGDVVAKGAD